MRPYYEHAGITIYHGDCREILPSVQADVVVADPPYGMNKADWDCGILPVDSWLPQCRGTVAVFTGVRGLHDYPKPDWVMSWTRLGSTQRCGCLGGFNNWEPILLYGVAALSNDVIAVPNYHHDFGHPTTKPLPLLSRLLSLLPRGSVLDPFLGSGTTLVAAKNAGRRAIGIEIDERYCDLAARRLAQDLLPLEFTA